MTTGATTDWLAAAVARHFISARVLIETLYSAALLPPSLNLLAARALRSLLEPINEPSTRNSGRRLGAIDRTHRDDEPLGGIFDDYLHQRTLREIGLNRFRGHPSPP